MPRTACQTAAIRFGVATSNGCDVHAERIGQIALGREALAGAQPAGLDVAGNRIGQRQIKRTGFTV